MTKTRQKTFDAAWVEKWWARHILQCGYGTIEVQYHETTWEDPEGNEHTRSDIGEYLASFLGRAPTPSEEQRFLRAYCAIGERLDSYVRRMPEGKGPA